MRWCIFAALLLAWPLTAQSLDEIEKALLDEQKAWTLAAESSTGLTDYFASERQRLSSERSALESERLSLTTENERLAQEKSALEGLRLQLRSDRRQISEDSKRLDEREKRISLLRRVAPWAAAVVFGAGLVAGLAVK